MSFLYKYLYTIIVCLIIIIFCIISISMTQESDNVYEAEIIYDDNIISLVGKATYVKYPLMYSFYFEESNSIKCGLHIKYKEGNIEEGVYSVNSEENNYVNVTCVRKDDKINERIVSTAGEFVVNVVKEDKVSGYYDVEMLGSITNTVYILKGQMLSEVMRGYD